MINDHDIELLLNDIVELYGYDFTFYSKASLKRRLNRLFEIDKFPSFAEFHYRIKSDKDYLQRFIEEITVNVTEMFRDPGFYKILRTEILPAMGTNPYIKIWHAGCSTGEEVFSMAILLKELNLLHKSLIYATDINPTVLEKFTKGIFPLSNMKQYSENYIASGGVKDFSSYYTANYHTALFDPALIQKTVHSTHNLVSDGSFNEFNLILCRNVLIYFDSQLQDRVFNLFDESLAKLGYLCLGSKESLKFSVINLKYKQHAKEKIWRKIK
ncbi:MAG: protein-glutamate O-methyltransferase CheR [Bacteroidia bacterium]|nr:protein-glutamate O-methyltransferase CheR [Bacteroidia bacterium]